MDASTIYFSDRPERIAGHMTTETFVDIWDNGDDSFKLSNPNAALSFLDDVTDEVVIVALSHPVLKDGNLTYDVTVLDGELPSEGGACSLFIDTLGRPASPGSVAGVHRRHRRRHVIVGTSIARNHTYEAEQDADRANDRADDAEADADRANERADDAEADAAAANASASAATTSAATTAHSPSEKMDQLNKMYKEGLIDDAEYEKKKQEILDTF